MDPAAPRPRSRRTLTRADDVCGVPLQVALDVLDCQEQAVPDYLRRLPRVVRGEYHVGEAKKRVIRIDGLLVEDIEPGSEETLLPEGLKQCVPIHQCRPRGVHEDRAWLDQPELPPAQEAVGFRGQAQVKTHHVGFLEQLFFSDRSRPERADPLGVTPEAPAEGLHPNGLAKPDHPAPDGAETEQPEAFSVKGINGGFPRPAAGPHLTVVLRDPTGHGQHESERVLGHRVGVDSGGVAHRDAVAPRRLEIDVVNAGAPDRDQLEARVGAEEGIGELGVGPDVDDDLGVPDAPAELGFLIGSRLSEDLDGAEALEPLMGRSPMKDRREVVGDGDQGVTPDLRTLPGRRPLPRRIPLCSRGHEAPVPGPTGWEERRGGWR